MEEYSRTTSAFISSRTWTTKALWFDLMITIKRLLKVWTISWDFLIVESVLRGALHDPEILSIPWLIRKSRLWPSMIRMFSKWIRNKHLRFNSSLNTRVVSVDFMPGECSLGVTLTLLFRDTQIQRCLQCNMFWDKGGKAKHGGLFMWRHPRGCLELNIL